MAVSAVSQHEAALMALREVPAACATLVEAFCMSLRTASTDAAMLSMQMLSVTMSSRRPAGARRAPCRQHQGRPQRARAGCTGSRGAASEAAAAKRQQRRRQQQQAAWQEAGRCAAATAHVRCRRRSCRGVSRHRQCAHWRQAERQPARKHSSTGPARPAAGINLNAVPATCIP